MHSADDLVMCWVTLLDMWLGILMDLMGCMESMMSVVAIWKNVTRVLPG